MSEKFIKFKADFDVADEEIQVLFLSEEYMLDYIKYWYPIEQDLPSILKNIECKHSGYDVESGSREAVWYFTSLDIYIKFYGIDNSYEGSYLEGMEEVVPKKVTVIQYHKLG